MPSRTARDERTRTAAPSVLKERILHCRQQSRIGGQIQVVVCTEVDEFVANLKGDELARLSETALVVVQDYDRSSVAWRWRSLKRTFIAIDIIMLVNRGSCSIVGRN